MAKKVEESAKLQLFLDLLEELLSENRKILVFSQFTSMLFNAVFNNEFIHKYRFSLSNTMCSICCLIFNSGIPPWIIVNNGVLNTPNLMKNKRLYMKAFPSLWKQKSEQP
jgi:hypothetical protein